jgi:transcriptional regulator with XRE-family HTH domain
MKVKTNISLDLNSPSETQRMLAERIRAMRVAIEFKQSTLAKRAGVALSTLRRFEQTGEVSMKHLMLICHALGRLNEFENLFRPLPATTMAELESQFNQPKRRRGSR